MKVDQKITSAVASKTSELAARISAHLHDPLYRNGYALASSAVISAFIGMIYWILAARIYPAPVVGVNSAVISAMMLLAGIAQLNLSQINTRFIPTFGERTMRFVRLTYLVSLGAAFLVSLIFLFRINLWAPSLGFLVSNPWLIVLFVIATMVYSLFVIEDGVLTGLRRALWVPVENGAFGLVKVALLLEFARIVPQLGVFASWIIGLLIIVIPTTYYIFRELIPYHIRNSHAREANLGISKLTQYMVGDYIGATAWLAASSLMPIIVIELAGATANAYYYLSWQVALMLYSISKSLGSSLMVEAARRPDQLRRYSLRVIGQSALLIVPVSLVLAVAAPLVLRLFGKSYAAEGTALLRLLALSGIPYILVTTEVSILRVQRRVMRVAGILGALCVLVLVSAYWLIPRVGVVGAGYAWLGSQSVIAGAILITRLTDLKSLFPRKPVLIEPPEPPASPGIQDPTSHARSRLGRIARPWQRLENWSRLRTAAPLIPEMLDELSRQARLPAARTWQVQYLIQTETDRTVLALGPSGSAPQVLAKLPSSEEATRSLANQTETLRILTSIPGLAEWQAILPVCLAHGEIHGQPFMIERMLPGRDARLALTNPEVTHTIRTCAANTIGELHQRTALVQEISASRLVEWIDTPLALVRQAIAWMPGGKSLLPATNRLSAELYEAFHGRQYALSWTHGDFVLGNILVRQGDQVITGIIDWELANPNSLPGLDILQLLVSTRREVGHAEIGKLVADLIRERSTLNFQEQGLLESAQQKLPGDAPGLRPLLLLFWLQHVGSNLSKSVRYSRHTWWIYNNLRPVLRAL